MDGSNITISRMRRGTLLLVDGPVDRLDALLDHLRDLYTVVEVRHRETEEGS